ncbi:MAG: hypothetical protein ABIK33_02520 [candidate division WOR-3 bacterium]
MFKIIDNKTLIKKAHHLFLRKLNEQVDRKIHAIVGFLGGSVKKSVSWIRKFDIWYTSSKGRRYGHMFGIGEPKKTNNSITCEINFLVKGIDRRIGGAFAEDDIGNVYLVHRGKIGGGKKGIGKKLFFEKYPKKNLVTVTDGDKKSKVALIGKLNSPNLVNQIAQFIHKVESIKKSKYKIPLVRRTAILSESNNHSFNKEFSGIKIYEKEKRKIESNGLHGKIVNTLESILREYGYKTANTTRIDLYLYNEVGKIKTIFEVKTNINGLNLYAAIGQLYLNSINFKDKIALILVCPEFNDDELVSRLNRLNIKVLSYRSQKNKVIFPNLTDLIPNL